MSKINLDKYYTDDTIVTHCINVVNDLIGDITETIEPSAGNGAFSLKIPKCIAYDIEPEHESIIKQDFLKLDLPYKKGRLFIGNPPFGIRNTLSVKFFKHAIKMGDYIAFILPISQLNNNNQMYEFDLIHSEIIDNNGFVDLDKRIKLAFNIYKRNHNGLNKKPNYKLNDVIIKEARKGVTNKITDDYDIGICSFGWSVGKEPEYIGQYANEFYLYIKNDDLKDTIIDYIKNANWREIVNMTGIEKINQWQVFKYLKDNIENIK